MIGLYWDAIKLWCKKKEYTLALSQQIKRFTATPQTHPPPSNVHQLITNRDILIVLLTFWVDQHSHRSLPSYIWVKMWRKTCYNWRKQANCGYASTEYTRSGEGRFLTYIQSRWKIQPGWWRWGMHSAHPPPFTIFTIKYKVAVNAPAEVADTISLFLHCPYVLWEKSKVDLSCIPLWFSPIPDFVL